MKVAACTPKLRVADPEYNAAEILSVIRKLGEEDVKVMVFPELALSGYTCGDLFLSDVLITSCRQRLIRIAEESAGYDALIFIGLPMAFGGKLYNAAAALHRGEVLGIIPKENLPNYSEFYEARHFAPGFRKAVMMELGGKQVPFGTDLLFENGETLPGLKVACEICEDAWVSEAPSGRHAKAGATLIVNLSASDEVIGKDSYRRKLVSVLSAAQASAYLYASAGEGESTQDLVFGGHDLIAENGSILSESELFRNGSIVSEIDVARLIAERRRMNTFRESLGEGYVRIPFFLDTAETELTRRFDPAPFVPKDKTDRRERCEQIFTIQAMGLKKRLEAAGIKNAVLGLSGGLDSTLALLVTVRSFDLLGLPRDGIHAVTMPCFGTTDRTYDNACELARTLGVGLREIDIRESVRLHMKDIGHDEADRDVTYENCQARERTQVLMDLANKLNGLVVGTGDLSELALGWATYNGDHMSMYGVNAGVPKTLVRHLVSYRADEAAKAGDESLSKVLADIVDTPVSPELLPPEDGIISQKTEELVGPYELHDYFLYYFLRFQFPPKKIFRMACLSFEGAYDRETILKWLKVFVKRFFTQQFKRSCLPDGPKVGTAALSPRGDWRMPSDASSAVWLKELEEISC